MKHCLLLSVLLLCFAVSAQAQSYCPGLHNPTSFSPTPGGCGYWTARVGDRVEGTGGSTGSNVLSTCTRSGATVLRGNASITSSSLYSGYCQYRCGSCNECTQTSNTFLDAHDHRFTIYTASSSTPSGCMDATPNSGMDYYTINPAGQGMQRIPTSLGHSTSIRLGDMRTTGQCQQSVSSTGGNNKGSEALYYTMQVNSQNALLFIDYAVVACKYDHSAYQAGEFTIRVVGKNSATGQWNNYPLNDSLWFNVPAPHITGSLPTPWVDGKYGTASGATTCGYCYIPWTRVSISLLKYLYDSVRVEMYTSDCIYNVDPLYAYIAGDCQPMTISTSGCPAGSSTDVDTLRAPSGMLTYTWYVAADGYSGNTSDQTAMSSVPWRLVQASSANGRTYVARSEDFLCTSGANAGQSVGITTYKCVMTSAMDPAKPFESVLYSTVSNTKPVISTFDSTACDGTVFFESSATIPYQGSGAPRIVDSLTTWEIHEGSSEMSPVIDTVYGRLSSYKFSDMDAHAVKVTVHEDCDCYSEKVFVVNPTLPPTPQISIDKRTLCVGEEATITDLTENLTGRKWVFEDTTISSTAQGNNLSNTAVITRDFKNFENPFMLIVTNETGCADTLYDTIYFFHDPEIHYSNDTIICNGHETHVTASTPVEGCTFEWYRHRDRAGEAPISSGPVLMVRPTQQRTKYYLKIYAQAGCVAWDSVYVNLLTTKITADPASAKFCPGDSVTLTGSGALYYEWYSQPDDPALTEQAHNQTIHVAPAQDTRYYMIGYAADSCDIAAIDILVQRVELPVLDLEYNPEYIDTETPVVTLTDKSQGRSTTKWFFGDGGRSSGETVTHHFDIYADSSNVVTMESYNELGCYVDTTFTIEIDTFGFYIPNVFTPNKASNNYFSLYSPNDLDAFHIAIFNRRGLLVYESDDPHFQWDGTRGGEALSGGAYPYVITYRRAGQVSDYRVKGTVLLVR